MGTLADYPAPGRPLQSTDLVAGWVDGQQVAAPVAAVTAAAAQSAQEAIQPAVDAIATDVRAAEKARDAAQAFVASTADALAINLVTVSLVNSLGGLTQQTFGVGDADGENLNPAVLAFSSVSVPGVGIVDQVTLNMGVAGTGLIVVTDASGSVLGVAPVAAQAGTHAYLIPPINVLDGALVGFKATSGAALRYDPGRGTTYVRVEGGPASYAVGDRLIVTSSPQTVLLGLAYRFKALPRLAEALGPAASKRPIVQCLVGYGQSLSVGTTPTGASTPTMPHADGRVRMFNGGVRIIRGDYNAAAAVVADDLSMLVPAGAQVEGGGPPYNQHYGQTHLESLGYKLAADLGWNVAMFTAGVGGASWAQLNPGTVPWTNLTTAAIQMRDLLDAEGYDVEYVVTLRHGESEQADDRATYTAHLTTVVDAMSALLKGISGQAMVPFFMDQPPALLDRSEVPFAIMDVAAARTDFFVVGGMYGLPMVDQHMTSTGYFYDGDITAEYVKEWWAGGARTGAPKPLRILTATYNAGARALDVQFAGQKGDLSLDTGSATPAIAGYGLELFDANGAGPSISAAPSNLGNGLLRFPLSAAWTAAARRIRTAYTKPTSGAFGDPAFYCRTNLRDTLPIASRLDNTRLYRRLVACDVSVS